MSEHVVRMTDRHVLAQCASCNKFVRGTPDDPIISAKSLGWKNYHYACAKAEWARKGLKEPMTKVPARAGKAERKTQFHVQCVLVENGVPSEQYQWHFVTDTLKEAEAICDIQMESFDKTALAEHPAYANYNCNMTDKKYVNCTISLLMKSGKQTVIDERIHSLALAPAPAVRRGFDYDVSEEEARPVARNAR